MVAALDAFDVPHPPEIKSHTCGTWSRSEDRIRDTANWDELDPKHYKSKAEVVSAFEKSISDSQNALKAVPAEKLAQSVTPWLAAIEHSAEHYGQLVTYYRLNKIVPPASRPKS